MTILVEERERATTPAPELAGPDRPETDRPENAPGLVTRLLLGLIRSYQLARGGRASPCRYLPSCSIYATTALRRYGPVRGGWLATRRLCRCHPWGGFGADPVPDLPPRSGTRNSS